MSNLSAELISKSSRAIILNFSTSNIEKIVEIFQNALGFKIIPHQSTGEREVVLYNRELSQHLFICFRENSSSQEPLSEEHLLIFYLNSIDRFNFLSSTLLSHGIKKVTAFNPYWDQCGTTFLLPDNFRLILCPGTYSSDNNYRARIAMPANNLESVYHYFSSKLGFKKIDEFHDHEDFDGLMLAVGTAETLDCHFEFTHYKGDTHLAIPLVTPSAQRFSSSIIIDDKALTENKTYHDDQGHYVTVLHPNHSTDQSLLLKYVS